MAQYTGLRNFWWLNTAMLSITWLMVAIGFAETMWYRINLDELARMTTKGSHPRYTEGIPNDLAKGRDLKKPRTPDLSRSTTSLKYP